ncbi:MAG: DUF4836 family protein [Raineya sp.]|nr:DUF4836 family protein [Raineya sp.]
MIKSIFITFFTLLVGSVMAQSLESRLSSNKTALLISLNADNYKSKGKFQTLLELDFIKKLDERLKKDKPKQYKTLSGIYKNPEEAGISAFPKSYVFVNTLDSNAIMGGLVFNITDAKKFEAWAKVAWEGDGEYQQIQVEGFNTFIRNDEAIAWSGNCGVIAFINSSSNPYRNINYDDPNYEAKVEELERANKTKKLDLIKKEIAEILKGNTSNPIQNNDNFKLFASKSHDVGIWINYESFNNSLNGILKNIPELSYGATERFASRLKSFYKDYYDHIILNVNKGDAKVTYQTYLSEKIYQIFGNAFNTRINPDFYKYVDGEKLLGMYAVSGDLKVLGNGLMELYKNFSEDLTKEGKIIAASMDVASIFLDEEDILSVMKGDFMIAFTSVKELEVQYTDYQYDGDVYLGPVKKTRKEITPMYVMTMTIGNAENLQKFIKLGNVLGGFKQLDGYYEVQDAGKVRNFFAIDNNVLVISNDEELISKNLQKARKKPVESRIQKLTQDNPMLVYVNTQNVLDAILSNAKELSAEEKKDLLEMKKDLGEFQMTGPLLQGKTFNSEGILLLNNKKENSLSALVRLFNRFVKERRTEYAKAETAIEEPTDGKKKKKKKKEH